MLKNNKKKRKNTKYQISNIDSKRISKKTNIYQYETNKLARNKSQ